MFTTIYNQINQSLVLSKTHFGTSGDDFHWGIWGNDLFYSSFGADVFFGNRGNDTVTYKYSNAAVSVDLSTGRGSGGTAQDDRYYSIENITGSRFGDQIKGNDANNRFDGGAGDDTFRASNGNDKYDGGHGRHDRIEYFDLDNGIVVNFNGGGLGQVHQAGSTKFDTFTNVEEISGTHFDDVFIGDDTNNWFFGAAGDDGFIADAGRDKYYGGFGVDTIILDGDGMTINLDSGRGYGGVAEGDKYTDINNVTVSGKNNTVEGDKFANVIVSTGQNVQISTGGGSDAVILSRYNNFDVDLGRGDDTLMLNPDSFAGLHFLGIGYGQADGGSGSDTLDLGNLTSGVIYSTNPYGGIFVANASNAYYYSSQDYGNYEVKHDPFNEINLSSFENIIGTYFDDIFVANHNIDETFTGGDGADEFYFALSDGNNDVITDFELGTDILHLFGLRIGDSSDDNFNALINGNIGSDLYIQDTAEGVLIHIFDNDIMLQGVQSSELSESDFLWS